MSRIYMNNINESVNIKFMKYINTKEVREILQINDSRVRLRIPMISASDSDGRRPPVPKQGGRV